MKFWRANTESSEFLRGVALNLHLNNCVRLKSSKIFLWIFLCEHFGFGHRKGRWVAPEKFAGINFPLCETGKIFSEFLSSETVKLHEKLLAMFFSGFTAKNKPTGPSN